VIEFWFWKPIGELLGAIALALGILVIGLLVYFADHVWQTFCAWRERDREPMVGDIWSTNNGDLYITSSHVSRDGRPMFVMRTCHPNYRSGFSVSWIEDASTFQARRLVRAARFKSRWQD
jgi:hypothetical protein